MVFIDGTALSVAMPALQTDLRTTGANLLWVTNGFSLPLAALLLFGGALGDCLGRRRIFMLGIVIFAIASLACGFSPTIEILIIARVAQGVGGALMIPGSLAMISSFFPPGERGKAIGAWSAFSVLATTIGPVFGGVLASAGLWRGVFFLNLPLAAISRAILVLKIPRDVASTSRVRLDVWGAFTVTVGLAALNFGFVQWSAEPLSDPIVWSSLLAGIAALVAFVLIQTRVDNPLLPLDVFRSRALTGACLLSFLFYMGFHGTLFFLPLNLIQVQGYSPTAAGLTQVPLMVLLVLLSTWAGRMVDRRGPRLPLTIGPAVAGMGFLLLAYPGVTTGSGEFATSFLPGIALIGVGLGLTAAPLSTTVMVSVHSQRLGLASGINSSVTRLAGVFAIAVLGPLMLTWFSHSLQENVFSLGLAPDISAQLKREAAKLAAAQVPAELSEEDAAQVSSAIKAAFVDAFRWVVGIAAMLCWAGALIAARLLPGKSASAARGPVGDATLSASD
jgi:EmrB/QacA subfamily drug resistance transporter